MGRASNPATLSEHFGVESGRLRELGVLNVTLAMDTRLFIDPLLLEQSVHPEMRSASKVYRKRFEDIIQLLSRSQKPYDVAWRGAMRLMQFHEIGATCLGYGTSGTSGSGFGPELIQRMVQTSSEIVNLGITDPDIFALVSLFEEGIGADRISDMTTSVILSELVNFTTRIANALGIKLATKIVGKVTAKLPENPYSGRKAGPLLLVPNDVLRPLPVAMDRDTICLAVNYNEELRARVNTHIAEIWTLKTKADRARMRARIISDARACKALLDAYHSVEARAYDTNSDPEGLLQWAQSARQAAHDNPLSLKLLAPQEASTVVSKIIDQFAFLIEKRGLWKCLYHQGKPHHEHYSQCFFFAVAHSYCKANNLDISPEVDTGSGRIDFKFSSGFATRVNVEIKLSTNGKVVDGYQKQIVRYNEVEETYGGFYVVMDVGNLGTKHEKLIKIRNEASRLKQKTTEIVVIDALRKDSASNL